MELTVLAVVCSFLLLLLLLVSLVALARRGPPERLERWGMDGRSTSRVLRRV